MLLLWLGALFPSFELLAFTSMPLIFLIVCIFVSSTGRSLAPSAAALQRARAVMGEVEKEVEVPAASEELSKADLDLVSALCSHFSSRFACFHLFVVMQARSM